MMHKLARFLLLSLLLALGLAAPLNASACTEPRPTGSAGSNTPNTEIIAINGVGTSGLQFSARNVNTGVVTTALISPGPDTTLSFSGGYTGTSHATRIVKIQTVSSTVTGVTYMMINDSYRLDVYGIPAGSGFIYNGTMYFRGVGGALFGVGSGAEAIPGTASCLADLLGEFRAVGSVGAGIARGFGGIAFDGYDRGPDAPALPSPSVYLDYVASRREEMIAWAMRENEPVAPAPRVKGKGRKGVEAPTAATGCEPRTVRQARVARVNESRCKHSTITPSRPATTASHRALRLALAWPSRSRRCAARARIQCPASLATRSWSGSRAPCSRRRSSAAQYRS